MSTISLAKVSLWPSVKDMVEHRHSDESHLARSGRAQRNGARRLMLELARKAQTDGTLGWVELSEACGEWLRTHASEDVCVSPSVISLVWDAYRETESPAEMLDRMQQEAYQDDSMATQSLAYAVVLWRLAAVYPRDAIIAHWGPGRF